jgi:hydroxypyruvate reductase
MRLGTAVPESPTDLLLEAFRAGLAAVAAEKVLPSALPPPPSGRTVVVGAGKASAAMARALEEHWPSPEGDGEAPRSGAGRRDRLSGLVVVPDGYAVPCERIEVVEAAHPIPADRGRVAARRILRLVEGLSPEDLVIALFSGGGSALLPLPAHGVSMADKQFLTRGLLRAGATIRELNCVRSHLSAIKGGRLARAAAPARVVNLLVSDVAGDDPALIASGPCVPDPSTLADARRVLKKYDLRASPRVLAHLADSRNETPKPGDPLLGAVSTTIVASADTLLEAAADYLRSRGIATHILSASIEGESRQVALVQAALVREIRRHRRPFPPPCVLLSGGETSVTVRGAGRGGPNMEFLLALLTAMGEAGGAGVSVGLASERAFAALACDTDGSDGSSGVAGALVGPDAAAQAWAAGLDIRAALETNDFLSFFESLNALVTTGPTLTNVNDFRAVLILAQDDGIPANVSD